MANIPTQLESPKGFHARYHIQKVVLVSEKVDDGSKYPKRETKLELQECDKDAEYFVMRLDTGGSDLEHIKACRIGIHAYADAIEHHLPELAKDLKERYPLL